MWKKLGTLSNSSQYSDQRAFRMGLLRKVRPHIRLSQRPTVKAFLHRGLRPPSEKEKCWMNSFAVFRDKVDTLLAINSTGARAELFLLLNAALSLIDGQNKQFISFIERETHAKVFLEAYMAFLHKTLEIHAVRNRLPIQERQALLDSGDRIVHVDTKTWQISELKCIDRHL